MKQYKRKKSESILLLGFSIIFFGMIFFFYDNPTRTWFTDIVFGGIGLFGLYGFMESLVVITLTGYTIVIKYPLLPEKEINFTDIYSLGDSNVSQNLILRDYYGNKIVTISKTTIEIFELKDRLRNIIGSRARIEYKDYFVRADSFFVVMISMCVFMVVTINLSIYLRTVSTLMSLIAFLFTLYFIYSMGSQSMYVHLNENSIIVKNLFKERVFSMMEIEDIVQKTKVKDKNDITTSVVIELKKGKQIILSGFKPDDELLFQSCKYYFNNRRRAT